MNKLFLLLLLLISTPAFAETCYPPVPAGCTSAQEVSQYYNQPDKIELCKNQAIAYTNRVQAYNTCVDSGLEKECIAKNTESIKSSWDSKLSTCTQTCQKGYYATVENSCAPTQATLQSLKKSTGIEQVTVPVVEAATPIVQTNVIMTSQNRPIETMKKVVPTEIMTQKVTTPIPSSVTDIHSTSTSQEIEPVSQPAVRKWWWFLNPLHWF